jgi:hypothetical protein
MPSRRAVLTRPTVTGATTTSIDAIQILALESCIEKSQSCRLLPANHLQEDKSIAPNAPPSSAQPACHCSSHLRLAPPRGLRHALPLEHWHLTWQLHRLSVSNQTGRVIIVQRVQIRKRLYNRTSKILKRQLNKLI